MNDINKLKIINENIEYEEDENGNKYKVIIRTVEKENKTYESIKKAVKKYQENNKEKVNKNIADWKRNKYQNDPEFREKQKQMRREYYNRKKLEKNT